MPGDARIGRRAWLCVALGLLALARQGIHVLTVPRAGHGMLFDNPDGMAEALVKALAT